MFADSSLPQTCLGQSDLRGKNQYGQEEPFPGAGMEIIVGLTIKAMLISVPSAAKWRSYQEKVLIRLYHMLFS